MEGFQIALIAILVPLSLFLMVFGIIYLYKRERMAMIERGMDPRRYKPQSAPYQNLKWGLLLIGAGSGLFIAYILDRTIFRNMGDVDPLYFSLIAIFGGIGLFISFKMEKMDTDAVKQNKYVEVEE